MIWQDLGFIILILPLVYGNAVNTNFVRDYFSQQGVKHIAVHACWSVYDRVNFARKVTQLDLRLSYLPTNFKAIDLNKFFKVNYYKLGILLDLDCSESKEIFYYFDQMFFNETYFWMVTTSDEEAAIEILKTLPLSVNAEIVIVVRDIKTDFYTIYDVYNPSFRHGGELNVTRFGTWDPQLGLVNELVDYKYKRRGDLHGLNLNFSAVLNNLPKGMDMISFLENSMIYPNLDSAHRHSWALVAALRDYYNFSINLQRQTTWGYPVNGTINDGILGDMINGVVDMSASPFRLKADRFDVMEYTAQGWIAYPTVILRHPSKNALTNQFFKPFTREVWFFTVLTAFICCFLLYLTIKAEQYFNRHGETATLDSDPSYSCALITTAAVCQQGLSEGPKPYSGRIVFLCLFLWALMLNQFYCASIVGSLLAAPPRFLTTGQALLESSMEFGAEDIPYNYDVFSTDPDPVVQELSKKKLSITKNRKKTYFPAEEGLKKVQMGGFAYQIELATAYKIIEDTFNEDEICDLQEIQLIQPFYTTLPLAKHSPFKKMFTYGIRRSLETGLSYRQRKVWHNRRPECPESHNSLPTPVAFQEFCPVLFMLAGGVALASFIMFAENLIRNHWRFIVKKITSSDRVSSIQS